MRPANIRTFVPFQAEPAQGIKNLFLRFGAGAHLIGIFDAQNELTAVLAGKALIEQCNVGSAHMGVTGGGRRDTGTDSHEISRHIDSRAV
jgi:hypothetical protein